MANPYSLSEIQPEPSANDGNPYALGSIQNDQKIALRSSLTGAVGTNPDEAGKAINLSRAVGSPYQAVKDNLPQVEQTAKLDAYEKMLAGDPTVAQFMTTPRNADAAHDDIENLSAVGQGVRVLAGIGRSVAALVPSTAQGFYGVVQAGAEGLAALTQPGTGRPSLSEGPLTLAARMLPENPFSRVAEGVAQWRREQEALAKGIRPQGYGPYASAAFSGVESAGQSALALLTGNPTMALTALAGVQGGQSYGQARDKGLPFGQALPFAASQAAIEYATEKIPVAAFLHDFKAGTPFYSMVTRQMIAEGWGEQWATHLQDLNEWAVLNPEKPFQSYLDERPAAFVQTLIATMVSVGALSGTAKGVQKVQERFQGKQQDAAAAQVNADALTQTDQAAAASKLRPRDAATFNDFVKQATADGPVQDVFIDVQSLAQSGVDVQALAAVSPAVATQLAEATATGGSIRIPLDEYTTNVAGTDLSQALVPYLKTDPLGMNQVEAQEFMQSGADQFRQEVERTLSAQEPDAAFKASRDAVQTRIADELGQVNRFTPAVNQQYATLMANFYAVQGARLGVTPEEMAARYPIKFAAASLTGGEALSQPANSASQSDTGKQVSEQPQATQQEQPLTSVAQTPDAGGGQPATPGAQPVANPQETQQGKRGSLSVPADITQETPVLTLLENADLSTFLHESGHFYLEVLADMAAREDAPQPIKDDMDAVLKWFGVPDLAAWRGMTLDQKRENHEKFARGFESYLFEGKSPSEDLRGAFQRFRAWMVNVYRSLRNLNVELTDEVRSVFDRMLATSDAIANQQAVEGAAPLFDSAQAAGMTEAQWSAYQNLNNDAQQDALQNLETRSLRDMKWLNNARSRTLKELQKQADAARAAVRDEVAAEVYATPLYSAMQFLRRGTATIEGEQIQAEAGHKLDIEALKEMYPEGALDSVDWSKLGYGQYGMLGKDGLAPDLAAQMFGYTSGDQLVRSLLDAEPVNSVIDGMTDARMLERHGDLTDARSMARAADQAIHNDVRARFVATELNALQQAVGQKKILASAARQFADAMVARLRVRDVRPGQFTAAEGRAARASEQAFKKGDIETAALEKRNQLVNTYAAKAAYAAQTEIQKGVDYLKKFDKESTRKSLDPSYIDQIDSLLERFDLRTGQSLKAIDKRKSLAEWVKTQEDMGLEPVIDPALVDGANRQSYKDMTVEELRGLVDAVKNIEHLGRLKKKLLTAKDQRDFEEHRDALRASIEDHAKRTLPEESSSDRGLLVDPRRIFRGFKAMHRKFASFAREFDGWKDAGAAWSDLVRPMNERGDFEAVENEKATIKLSEMFDALRKDGKLGRKTYIPEIGKSLTREQRIGIALNMGNAINKERVMTGEKWTPSQLDAVLDKLTENDWRFVQEAWDYIGSFKPAMAAKERRLTGVEPQWVEAEPVQTKYGELRGGYYPIRSDPRRNNTDVGANIVADVQKQMERGLFARAQTRRGHLQARVESTGRKLDYSLTGVGQHVQQVIHDLAWHEYLVDANRLLRDSGVDEAIRRHYGVEVTKELRDTLKDIAVGNVAVSNDLDRLFNHLRTGATVAGLGWRLTTSLMQPLGLTQSMSRIGSKWVLKGASHWAVGAMGLETGMKDMHEMSPFMRLRGKTMQREISEIRNKVTGEPAWKQKLHGSYFLLIQKAQAIADVPTWWGAYEKAMSQNDTTKDKAIALADQAVRDSQGAGQIGDLAGIQRGGTGLKLFTTFYNFFNSTFNLTAEAVGRTDFKKPKDVGLLAVDLALLWIIPSIISTAIKLSLKGDWDDEEKVVRTFIADQLSYLLGSMVGLRELGAAGQAITGSGGGDYTGPASVRIFADTAKLMKQARQGEADMAFFKALASVTGVLFHLPAGQVMATADGVAALADGRTENPGALLVGAPPK